MQLEVGDVVRLKSGGPDMTVEGVGEQDVDCVWFQGNNVLRNTFGAALLQKATPKGPAFMVV